MSTTKTGIEWTDRTWNPVRGCSRVSEGCRNCYAEKVAARFSDEGQAFHLFADRNKSGSKWTGKVELIEPALQEPMKWRKPVRIFVNSMSDLFHENLPVRHMDLVFAVMSQSPRHTFQVLTKRPRQMYEYLTAERTPDGIDEAAGSFGWCHANMDGRWPLPNVWLGVSVEDQATADERIPLLLQTPAAVRFVSYEPALGPVDFGRWLSPSPTRRGNGGYSGREAGTEPLDWIIVGGESGPGARPFDIEWARKTIWQCEAAGVACFVKQLGTKPFVTNRTDYPTWPGSPVFQIMSMDEPPVYPRQLVKLKDRKGGDWLEWPADLRVRQFPKATA